MNEYPHKGFTTKSQLGWVAQDVSKHIPEIVETDAEGYLYVSYGHASALVGQAVSELAETVETQKVMIDSLTYELEALKSQMSDVMKLLKTRQD